MTQKEILRLIKVIIVFFGVMFVVQGVMHGCHNIQWFPGEGADVAVHYVSLPIYLLLNFSLAIIGFGLICGHRTVVQWLVRFAGTPEWHRRYIHAQILVLLGVFLLAQSLGSFLISLGIMQKGIPLRMALGDGFIVIFALVTSLIPGVFLLVGAKAITRQIDRWVLSKKKK